jgi:uncharacterized protein with von Willebrand factor type A (vWA) domain
MEYRQEFKLKSVLNTDSFDRNMYADLRESSKTLQQAEEAGSKDYPAFPHLLGDTWAGLFKNTPELSPDCPKGVEVNQALMEKVLEHPEFQSLREYTKLDELASALGACQMGKQLSELISQNQEAQKSQQEAQKQQKKADQAQSAAEALKEAAQMAGDAKKQKELMDKAKKQLSEAKKAQKNADKATQQAIEAIQQQLDSSKGQEQLGQAIAQATQGTKEDKQEVDSLLASMGYGTGPGEKKKVPARDRLALAEALKHTPKLKKIANYLGRMQKIANKKQKDKSNDSIARTGVDMGNELSAILPSELAKLTNDKTRRDFLKKFAQGELLQYSPKGKEKLGKGPIICCLDSSGSMESLDEQAKAFMLALLMIARKQKRAFACINYSSASEIKTWVYEQTQRIMPSEILEMAEFFWGGGTSFQSPLNKALEIITNSKFKKADIVFITDGSATVSDNWLSEFNQKKQSERFTVVSIKIGRDSRETLEKFSDKLVEADDFFNEATDAFEI